ncbi:interleukin-10 [Equus quagga]|uniref:interleukin-10 n=1 Tax=Equus quagga TaxID=89248 RepID=UPI001EE1EA00|nr:interleukin-10 [Equus quagga]
MQSWSGLGKGGALEKKLCQEICDSVAFYEWGGLIEPTIYKGDTRGEGRYIRALLLQNQTTRPIHRRRQSSAMPSAALLCCLVFLAGVGASRDRGTQSENSCTHFPTSLPHMLHELRAAFSRVKTFFQMKDQLDNMLLNGSLLEDFKGYLGCQALSEMIQFYLEEVMPQAENHGPDIKEHVNSLGEKLKTLRVRLRRCHRFLPCENKSKAVEQVKSAFSKLQEKGVYKAMSEFDIFINYIEAYMTTKMKN